MELGYLQFEVRFRSDSDHSICDYNRRERPREYVSLASKMETLCDKMPSNILGGGVYSEWIEDDDIFRQCHVYRVGRYPVESQGK